MEEGTTADLRNYICSILPQFMEDCEQATAYKLERKAIKGSENKALLPVDFSENYTCQYQDEIQSTHWNQHQVSLFTAALWHTGMLHSIVIGSDNLVHSEDSVVAYIDMLLEMIPDSVTTVSIWSDGPALQHKYNDLATGKAQHSHPLELLCDIAWQKACRF